jgi:hypothetical protein
MPVETLQMIVAKVHHESLPVLSFLANRYIVGVVFHLVLSKRVGGVRFLALSFPLYVI